jgi:predicted nucleic acid-binding protein
MKTDDSIFLDTNILVYAHQENAPFHNQSKNLRDMALKGELALCISPQVLTEFYSIITNPKRVTHPISSEKAAIEVEKYFVSRRIRKIYPKKKQWRNLLIF